MCGRFALMTRLRGMFDRLGIEYIEEIEPRSEIFPSQPVLVFRVGTGGKLEATHMGWGLVPSWSKDFSHKARMINARSETAAAKPYFRSAMKRRRCLLPADAFYEWKRTGNSKSKHVIRMRDRKPFVMAGLWETWSSPDGSESDTCCILTTGPNAVMNPIHDRMPVILAEKSIPEWLDHSADDASRVQHLLKPCPDDWLESLPVVGTLFPTLDY